MRRASSGQVSKPTLIVLGRRHGQSGDPLASCKKGSATSLSPTSVQLIRARLSSTIEEHTNSVPRHVLAQPAAGFISKTTTLFR